MIEGKSSIRLKVFYNNSNCVYIQKREKNEKKEEEIWGMNYANCSRRLFKPTLVRYGGGLIQPHEYKDLVPTF